MATGIEFNIDDVYSAWREYLLANSKAKYFGMVFDTKKQANFPYANFKLVGRPTGGSTLLNDESSINLTFETEAYINSNKYTALYDIDTASANFFIELGFRRVGNSEPIKVSDTVTKITSRFVLNNYCGYFLKDLSEF